MSRGLGSLQRAIIDSIRDTKRQRELNDPDSAIGLPDVLNKAQRYAGDESVKPQPTKSEAMKGNKNATKGEENGTLLTHPHQAADVQ